MFISMEKMSVIQKLQSEIRFYEETQLKGNPSYAKTMPELLELIELYSNSQFRDAEYDEYGFKKLFYNISSNPRGVGRKEMDVDLGNINIETESGHDYFIGWLYEKELRLWLKENNASKLFNKIVGQFVDYGSPLIKNVGGEVYGVKWSNFIVDPTAETLEDSPFKIEKHEYTPAALRKMGREKKWYMNRVEEVIERAKNEKAKRITIYERYTEGDDEDYSFYIIASFNGKFCDDSVLYEGNRKPKYKMTKLEEVEGRLLGRGIIEKLFEQQIAKNDVNYYLQKGLRISSMHIFQSPDPNVAKNISLIESEDGTILHSPTGISPIPMEERNITGYNYVDQIWDKNIESSVFSYEAMGGQRPPSGMTLGSHALSLQKAGQFYELKKENLAIMLREMITDWIIPSFKKENKKSHKIKMMNLIGSDEDAQRFFNTQLNVRMRKKRLEMIMKGKFLMGGEYEIIKGIQADLLKQEDFEIPDEAYENIHEKVTVVITGEQLKGQAQMSILTTILNMVNNNPAVFENPINKKIASKILDRMGISPEEILPTDIPTIGNAATMARGQAQVTSGVGETRGGSLPRPQETGIGAIRQPITQGV